MNTILIKLVINSLVVFFVGKYTRLYNVEDFPSAFFFAISLSIVNVLIGTVFHFAFFIFYILTLGILYFLVNGFLLMLAGAIIPGIRTKGCLNSSIAAIIISVLTTLVHVLVKV